MKNEQIAQGLKESTLTPASYKPTKTIKTYKHAVVMANNIPLVGVGASDDLDTLFEAENLRGCKRLKELAEVDFETEVTLSVGFIDGSEIDWKDEEVAICKSKVGKVEHGNEDGEVHWIVYGKNSIGLATAMCLSKEIQNIAV